MKPIIIATSVAILALGVSPRAEAQSRFDALILEMQSTTRQIEKRVKELSDQNADMTERLGRQSDDPGQQREAEKAADAARKAAARRDGETRARFQRQCQDALERGFDSDFRRGLGCDGR
jgi:hypothetical protein